MNVIKKLVSNLSNFMLLYSSIAIAAGIFVSMNYHVKFLSNYILLIVFLMIYPMMVNVSFESLKKIKKAKKPLLIALVLNFIIAPLLFWMLCTIMHASPSIKIALILLAVAPTSSMGLGYVGLSRGNIVSASVIVALAFVLSLVIYPITFHFLKFGPQGVPLSKILKSLAFVLIIPLFAGLITREFIIEKRGVDFKQLKPIFSLITQLSLYSLIFTIFALKGSMIIKNWRQLIIITPIAIAFYTLMITITLLFNRHVAKISYADNQSIVFTSVSKNVALTIGLLASLGKEGQIMAAYPAIISLFQIVFLMSYLHLSNVIERHWVQASGTAGGE